MTNTTHRSRTLRTLAAVLAVFCLVLGLYTFYMRYEVAAAGAPQPTRAQTELIVPWRGEQRYVTPTQKAAYERYRIWSFIYILGGMLVVTRPHWSASFSRRKQQQPPRTRRKP